MKKFVVIPVRLGATRLPDKPLALIAGKPMVQRVFERASQASGIDGVVVAADDQRIVSVVEAFGGRAVLTDPGCASGSDRVAEAAAKLGLNRGDIVVNLQGDQPLCPPELIFEVIQPLLAEPDLGLATLAIPMSLEEARDPDNVCVVCDEKGAALYFSRALIPHPRDADRPVRFLKHLGIYAFRGWFLEAFTRLPAGRLEKIEKLEMLRVLEHGHRIKVALTEFDSIEVDRPEDIVQVEAFLAERGEN